MKKSTCYYLLDSEQVLAAEMLRRDILYARGRFLAELEMMAVPYRLQEQMFAYLERVRNASAPRLLTADNDDALIGTATEAGFAWRVGNGFSDVSSVVSYLSRNPDYQIVDEFGSFLTASEFFSVVSA